MDTLTHVQQRKAVFCGAYPWIKGSQMQNENQDSISV